MSNTTQTGRGGPFSPARRNSRLTFPQRLVQVRDDVVFVLQTDGKADEVVRDARFEPLLRRQLLVGGGRRVDHEALGVADVRQVGEQLEVVDELLPRLDAALDAEPQDGAVEPPVVVLLRQRVHRVARQPR